MRNTSRLLTLASAIRSGEPILDIIHLDMRFYRLCLLDPNDSDLEYWNIPPHECGTRACIVGFTMALFNPASYNANLDLNWTTEARHLLGLSYTEADALFNWNQEAETTREQAALACERLANGCPPEYIWDDDESLSQESS